MPTVPPPHSTTGGRAAQWPSLFLVATALGGMTSAWSADEGLQGVQVHWDNDAFQRTNTDRHYTNGIRASWSWDSDTTSTMARTAKELAGQWLGGKAPTLTYSIGQSMYTPRDIAVAGPQPDDRPWGAFLYGAVAAHRYDRSQFRAIELKLGTTGSAAAGRQVQSAVHRYLTDSQRPAGWQQQLKARPGVQVSYLEIKRFGKDEPGGRDYVGFQAHWGGSAGTLRNYAHAGVAVMMGSLTGSNTPLSVANEGDFVVQDFNNREQFKQPFAYLAVGVSGVAYNYFLQGDTPYGRSQIDKKTLVPSAELGFSLPLQHYFDSTKAPRIMYALTVRGADFKSRTGVQPGKARYGNLSFHWDFQPN